MLERPKQPPPPPTHTHTPTRPPFDRFGTNATRRRAARGGRKAYTDKAASESEGGDSDEEEEDFNAEEFEVRVQNARG